jgi:hypothetical protein
MVIVFAKYMATVSYIAHFTGLWQTVLVTILFMAWLDQRLVQAREEQRQP